MSSEDEKRRAGSSAPDPAPTPAWLARRLRRREIPAGAALREARVRGWLGHPALGRALLRSPDLGLPSARRLVEHLAWTEQARAADDPRVHPVLRRCCERRLRERLPELTVGERVSLARIAGRAVIPGLLEDRAAAVLEAILANGRLREPEAASLAGSERAPSAVLARLSSHPVWSERRAVQLALSLNPRTPVPVALRALSRLSDPDLGRVAGNPRAPKIVRVGAERRLARGRNPARRL